MEFTDQVPFGGAEFAENPEPRCPCLLLLDTSGSMAGSPIDELNEGIAAFKEELMEDQMAVKRVELAIVSFGPVKVEAEFQTADVFSPPKLRASGQTPMGEAIETGLEMLRRRKEVYRENGISYYRPWVFLITDGSPTDSWKRAAELVHEYEQSKSLAFFVVAVEGAKMEILEQISVATRKPMRLKGLKFRELFSWLSNSLGAVSHSNTGDAVQIVHPASLSNGWAMIE